MVWSTSTIPRSPRADRRQWLSFLAVALGAVAAAALAQRAGVDFYARFLGRVPPSLAVVLAAALAAPLLAVLASRGAFAIRRRGDLRGPIVAAGLAGAFGLLIVAADGIIVFPRE